MTSRRQIIRSLIAVASAVVVFVMAVVATMSEASAHVGHRAASVSSFASTGSDVSRGTNYYENSDRLTARLGRDTQASRTDREQMSSTLDVRTAAEPSGNSANVGGCCGALCHIASVASPEFFRVPELLSIKVVRSRTLFIWQTVDFGLIRPPRV